MNLPQKSAMPVLRFWLELDFPVTELQDVKWQLKMGGKEILKKKNKWEEKIVKNN